MCYTITEEFQSSVIGAQRIMPWSLVTAIIDECAELGVYSMLFSWRGESSLYRSRDENGAIRTLPDVFAYARDKGILEITCLTNGQSLTPELMDGIVDAEPSWISFSVDGMGENYNKIRTPVSKRGTGYDAFKKIKENIAYLAGARDKAGKTRPQLRCNSIFPPISRDPEGYYRQMKEIGIGWITVNELLDFREDELPEDAIIPDFICQYPWQRLTVSANGYIVPCTGAHNEEHDMILGRYPGTAEKNVVDGNTKRTVKAPVRTLSECWSSQEMNRIRDKHRNVERRGIHTCKICRHGAVKHGVEWVPDDWNMETMEWESGAWKE
jgi:hypothetical protein